MYPWFRQIEHVILNPGPDLNVSPRPKNYSPGTPLHTERYITRDYFRSLIKGTIDVIERDPNT